MRKTLYIFKFKSLFPKMSLDIGPFESRCDCTFSAARFSTGSDAAKDVANF